MNNEENNGGGTRAIVITASLILLFCCVGCRIYHSIPFCIFLLVIGVGKNPADMEGKVKQCRRLAIVAIIAALLSFLLGSFGMAGCLLLIGLIFLFTKPNEPEK